MSGDICSTYEGDDLPFGPDGSYHEHDESSRADQSQASSSNTHQEDQGPVCNYQATDADITVYAFVYCDWALYGHQGDMWRRHLDRFASWHFGPKHFTIERLGVRITHVYLCIPQAS